MFIFKRVPMTKLEKKDCSSCRGAHDSLRQLCYQEVTGQVARLSQSGLADGLIRPVSLISLSLSLPLERRGIYITAAT